MLQHDSFTETIGGWPTEEPAPPNNGTHGQYSARHGALGSFPPPIGYGR